MTYAVFENTCYKEKFESCMERKDNIVNSTSNSAS